MATGKTQSAPAERRWSLSSKPANARVAKALSVLSGLHADNQRGSRHGRRLFFTFISAYPPTIESTPHKQ